MVPKQGTKVEKQLALKDGQLQTQSEQATIKDLNVSLGKHTVTNSEGAVPKLNIKRPRREKARSLITTIKCSSPIKPPFEI